MAAAYDASTQARARPSRFREQREEVREHWTDEELRQHGESVVERPRRRGGKVGRRCEQHGEREAQEVERARERITALAPHPAPEQQERRGDREDDREEASFGLGKLAWNEPHRHASAVAFELHHERHAGLRRGERAGPEQFARGVLAWGDEPVARHEPCSMPRAASVHGAHAPVRLQRHTRVGPMRQAEARDEQHPRHGQHQPTQSESRRASIQWVPPTENATTSARTTRTRAWTTGSWTTRVGKAILVQVACTPCRYPVQSGPSRPRRPCAGVGPATVSLSGYTGSRSGGSFNHAGPNKEVRREHPDR